MEERAKESEPNNLIINKEGPEVVVLQQLPQDILFSIFARLPLKPLIKLKTVCKFWFNIISYPNFIDFHLQQWISKLTIFAFKIHGNFRFYSFNFKEMSIKPNKHAVFQFDQYCFRKPYCIGEVATCDGLIVLLVLLDRVFENKLYIYNSITSMRKSLPPVPHLNLSSCNYSLVHDASIQMYKMIVCGPGLSGITKQWCILTLDNVNDQSSTGANTAAWRVISPAKMVYFYPDHPVAVKGVLHWMAETSRQNIYEEEEDEVFIQPFDTAREEFMERIEPPCQPIRSMGWGYPLNFTLLGIRGSLCLMNLANSDELDLWVLKGNTTPTCNWIMQHKITLSSMLSKLLSLKSLVKEAFNPVFVMESCSSCLTYIILRHYDVLFCFNLETQEFRQIAIENKISVSIFQPFMDPGLVMLINACQGD